MEKQLQPHQQRVVDELTELVSKAQKLSAFITTNPYFNELDEVDQSLLRSQWAVMDAYVQILETRIKRF